jgi:hypothetical protein
MSKRFRAHLDSTEKVSFSVSNSIGLNGLMHRLASLNGLIHRLASLNGAVCLSLHRLDLQSSVCYILMVFIEYNLNSYYH